MTTPQQSMDFFATAQTRAEMGLVAARKSGNFWLASVNLKQSLKNHLMQGLIKWRNGIGSPEKEFEHAVDGALQAHQILSEMDESIPLEQAYPVAIPAIVSSLVRTAPDPVLITLLPRPSQWAGLFKEQSSFVRETSLALALADPSSANELRSALFQLQPMTAEKLSQDSHDLYLALLGARFDETQKQTVLALEQAFRNRKTDSYYSGGAPFYGGGPENANVVDFMLAAALKRQGAPRDQSAHEWRWP